MRRSLLAGLIFATIASPAFSQDILDGDYLIEQVEPATSDVNPAIATELEASASQGWLRIDDHQMLAFVIGKAEPTRTTFSDDFASMSSDQGEVLPVEILDGDRIAVTVTSTLESSEKFRMTYRRVDAADPALTRLKTARAEAAPALRDTPMTFDELVTQRADLDLRVPLSKGEASVALPAYLSLEHDDRGYQGNARYSDRAIDWHQLTLLFPEDQAEVERIFTSEADWLRGNMTRLIEIDADTIAALDDYARPILLARGQVEGRPYVIYGKTSAAEFPRLMAIRDSIGPPIDGIERLRDFDVALPDDLIDQPAFDRQIDAALAALTSPQTLLKAPPVTPEDFEWATDTPEIDLRPDDPFDPVKFFAVLLVGAPENVLPTIIGTPTDSAINTVQTGADCQIIAGLPVAIGTDKAALTLVLRQRRPENASRCLLHEGALRRYDLDRPLGAEIAPGLIEQIGRFETADQQPDGSFLVGRDGLRGLISASGDVVIPLEYASVAGWDTSIGYVVELNGQKGLFATDGRQILPAAYDDIETRDGIVIVTRADKEGVFLPDGAPLLEPLYDTIFRIEDTPLLYVSGQTGRALFDMERREFVVSPSEGWTELDTRAGFSLILAKKDDGTTAIFDETGKLRLGPAPDIKIVAPNLFVVERPEDGAFTFSDLDGNQLLKQHYTRIWPNHAEKLISADLPDGRKVYLNFSLKTLTPDGVSAVYPPTEGGYSVVSNGKNPPLMGLAAPDGRLVIPPQFPQIFPVRDGIVSVQTLEGLWGVYDREGMLVQPPEWERLSQSFDGYLYGMKDGYWRQTDRDGRATDERRWYQLDFQFPRDGGDAFMVGKLAVDASGESVDPPRWEAMDLTGKLLPDQEITVSMDDNGRLILTDPDGTIQYAE